MLPSELATRLQAAQFGPELLAHEIVTDTRWPAQAALRHLDGENAIAAQMVVSGLGEHALAALSRAQSARAPEREIWILVTLGEGLRQFRRRAAERVDPLLSLANGNETPANRDCDEAYRLARELADAATESAVELNFDMFLAQPVAQRDAEIQRFRQSRPWTRLLAGF